MYSSSASIYLNNPTTGSTRTSTTSYGSGYPRRYAGYESHLGPVNEHHYSSGRSSGTTNRFKDHTSQYSTSKTFAYSGASNYGSNSGHTNTSYYKPVNHRDTYTSGSAYSSTSDYLSNRKPHAVVAPSTRRLSDAYTNSSSSSLASSLSTNSFHSGASAGTGTLSSSGYGTDVGSTRSRSSVLSRCLPKPFASTCSSILSRFSKLRLNSSKDELSGSGHLYNGGSSYSSGYPKQKYSSSSAYLRSSNVHHYPPSNLLPYGSSLSSSTSSSDEYLHLPPAYPKPVHRYHFRYPYSTSAAIRSTALESSYVDRGYPSISRYNPSSCLPSTTPYRSYLTAKKSISRNYTRCDYSAALVGSQLASTEDVNVNSVRKR